MQSFLPIIFLGSTSFVWAIFRYGRLNVGDQILVCDGVNLIDVTHDEAAKALKRAMDMDSVCCSLQDVETIIV